MSGALTTSPIQQYLSYSADEPKFAGNYALTSAQETNLTGYFQAHAASITSPAALLGDYKALSVVLGSFGIGNLLGSTALIKQLLTQDPSSRGSTAYRIGNAKYLAFAHALHNWTPPPFGTKAGVNAIVKAYQLNGFEASVSSTGQSINATSATAQDNGLQQALYFTRNAGAITSYTQLQSDPELLAVAVAGAGIPLNAYDNLSYEQQTALLKQKLPLANLKTPAKVQRLAEQFIVLQQLANGPSTAAPLAGSLLNAFAATDTSANSLLTILGAGSNAGTAATPNPLLSLFA